MMGTLKRSQLKMSITLVIAVVGILIVFTIALLLTSSLLRDISTNSRMTADRYLPELVRSQQGALKVEKIHTYLDAAYRVQDASEERRLRLLLQILVHSFMLDDDDYLVTEANNIMFDIRELLYIRHTQRQLHNEIINILDASDKDIDYAKGFFSAVSLMSIQERFIQLPMTILETQLPEESFSEVLYRIRFIIDLNEQLNNLVDDANQRIAGLSNYLNTDAALRTHQISNEVGNDAEKVRDYFSMLIGILVIFSVMILYAFQRLILRPVQELVEGLRSIEKQGDKTVRLRPMYFRELDVIRHAIEEYSGLMHRLQLANTELGRLSQIDGLTGLANRRSLDQVLDLEVRRSQRYQHPLALMMIDIDHFKNINDQFGHQVGDEGLKLLASILMQFSQRPGELAARYGGEEFVLVLAEASLSDAIEIAEKLLDECRKAAFPFNPNLHFTISIGISCYRNTTSNTKELLINHADQALYQAKTAGRDCFRIYD